MSLADRIGIVPANATDEKKTTTSPVKKTHEGRKKNHKLTLAEIDAQFVNNDKTPKEPKHIKMNEKIHTIPATKTGKPDRKLPTSKNQTQQESDKKEKRSSISKIDILKKKIAEQKKIQEEKKQKQLLDDFLNGDDKFEWTAEEEEEEVLNRLKTSLKI